MIGKTNAISGVSAPVPKIKTVSGSVISISDALAMPAVSLVADINAVQNLNGYDYPWPAGGGKNKFDPSEAQNNKWVNSSTGAIENVNGYWVTGYIPVTAGDVVRCPTKGSARNAWYNTDKSQATYVSYSGAGNGITAPADGFIVLTAKGSDFPFGSDSNFVVTRNDADLTYAPYENLCPISGWDAVKVTRTGKNLLPIRTIRSEHAGIEYTVTSEGIRVHGTSTASSYSWTTVTGYDNMWLKIPAGTYTFSVTDFFGTNQSDGYVVLMGYDYNGNALTNSILHNGNKTITRVFTSPVGLYYGIYVKAGLTVDTVVKIEAELGSTATAYEAYDGDTYTIDLDGTRYGGSLDVTTGALTVDRAIVDLGTLSWTYRSNLGGFSAPLTPLGKDRFNAICSAYPYGGAYSDLQDKMCGYVYNNQAFVKDSDYTDATTFKTAISGVQLVYELATPQTVQLSPTTVQMLLGNNVLWADSGDTELQYWARR